MARPRVLLEGSGIYASGAMVENSVLSFGLDEHTMANMQVQCVRIRVGSFADGLKLA